jgi:hypothetical protein
MTDLSALDQTVSTLKARGWAGAFSTMLDVIEPFGALGAQLTYIAQPALGLLFPRDAISALADALETPEGVAALREKLEGSEEL